MDVTVIVWLAIIAAILVALTATAIAVRRHPGMSDDDPGPKRRPDPGDRGFFE